MLPAERSEAGSDPLFHPVVFRSFMPWAGLVMAHGTR